MTDEKKTRKRKTPAERRALLEQQLKALSETERKEAIRLLAHAHDALFGVSTHPGAKPVGAKLSAAVASLKPVIAELEKAT